MSRTIPLFFVMIVCLMLAGCSGCAKSKKVVKKPKKKPGIKMTQDIGEYDPNAGWVIQDSKINASNPLTAAAEAFEPLLQKVSDIGITRMVNQYEIINGRYPTYDQFMKEIIKQYNMKLPVLPDKEKKYMYDVANHKLVVVKAPDAKKE